MDTESYSRIGLLGLLYKAHATAERDWHLVCISPQVDLIKKASEELSRCASDQAIDGSMYLYGRYLGP